MKNNIRYYSGFLLVVGLMAIFMVTSAGAESLYEQYTNMPKETLDAETSEMGKNLRNVFNEQSVEEYQQKIDFADYYANYKKLVLYGVKLANYNDYEDNLIFAKDKEIFKGLSAAEGETDTGKNNERKAFVNEKFDQMKDNIQDEIDTYLDLIIISLDACEIMSQNDLSGFTQSDKNQATINRFMNESEIYSKFTKRYDRLNNGWPEIAARITKQVKLWQVAAPSGSDPIIDRTITEAIL
jgi:hypothetical protein